MRGARSRSRRRARRGIPFVFLAVALIVTAGFARYVAVTTREQDRFRFATDVIRAERTFRARLDTYDALLRATRAFLVGRRPVTARDFHSFVTRLDLADHYPGLQGLGYAAVVAPEAADSLTAAARAEWDPGFHIWPDSARGRYTAVLFLEPLDRRNREAIGYDMATDSTRRAAMDRARDRGRSVVSGRVQLVQEIDDQKQPGFLIYSPVYRGDSIPATQAARRASLIGYVYAPLRAGDFFHTLIASDSLGGIGIRIYDGTVPRPDALLFATAAGGRASAEFSTTHNITLDDHDWTLTFFSLPSAGGAATSSLVSLILGGGVLVSLALFALSRAQVNARLDAERNAADLLRSQAAVREREQRFRELVEQSPLSIQLLARDGRAIQVNRAYEELWGVGLAGLDDYRVLEDPQLAAAGVTPLLEAAFEGRAVAIPPLAYVPDRGRRAGEEIWVSAHVYPVRDPNGVVREVVLIHENITERRMAERRLRYQLDLMNTITANAADALFLTDGDGRVTFVNPAAERIFGWEREAVLGRVLHDVIHSRRPDGTPYPVEACPLCRVLATGRGLHDHEDAFLRRDGSLVPVYCSMSPILRDDRVTSAVLVVRDVTERQAAEAALRESEERLRAIFSQVSVGIAQVRLDGSFMLANQRYVDMLGYTEEELRGLTLAAVTHPEDRDQSAEFFRELVRSGTPFSMEKRYLRRGGGMVWVSKSISVVRDASGRPAFAVLIAEDITERKQAEEALRHTQKLESIGLLAGGIAHDFNNLLTGILGNASLALRGLGSASPSALQPLLEDVIRGSERAADLTRQLLAYAGKGRFYLQPVALGRLVAEITTLLRSSISRRVELRLELARDVPLVEGDPGQLQQLVMNLVINAAEAVGDGNGAVTVRAQPHRLDAAEAASRFGPYGLRPGEYALIEVADDGVGMDPATLSRIFDPFFTTKFTGRGLGLAAALGIVRGHHGGIAVESSAGSGSRFSVLLPAMAAPAHVPEPPSTTPAPREPPAERGRSAPVRAILVADDEPAVLALIRSVLSEENYEVIGAADGRAAVAQFTAAPNRVALALLDLTMPVMGGEETAARLRALRPELPIIITSGYSETEARDRFGGSGMGIFLQKPFAPDALLAAVRAALG